MKTARKTFQILAILSLCMHVLATISPLWASESGLFQIQICSGDTWKTISIDENGNQIPDQPQQKKHDCVFCTNASLNGLEAAPAIIPPVYHTRDALTALQSLNTPTKKPSRAHLARAPPIFS